MRHAPNRLPDSSDPHDGGARADCGNTCRSRHDAPPDDAAAREPAQEAATAPGAVVGEVAPGAPPPRKARGGARGDTG